MKDEQDHFSGLLPVEMPAKREVAVKARPQHHAMPHQPLSEIILLSRWKIVKKSIPQSGRPVLVTAILFIAFSIAVFGESGLAPDYDLGALLSSQQSLLFALSLGLAIWLVSFPLYQYLYRKTYFYDIDEDTIRIRKGVIAKREAILPFSRITDVYLDRDLADVLFGLYDLHISTPTAESGKFAHIDGLRKAGAEQIRDMLLERISLTEPEHARLAPAAGVMRQR